MTNIPDVTKIWKCKSYDELSTIINNWLNGEEEAETVGTEWKTSKTTTNKTTSKGSSNNKENYSSLDDAFADLMD